MKSHFYKEMGILLFLLLGSLGQTTAQTGTFQFFTDTVSTRTHAQIQFYEPLSDGFLAMGYTEDELGPTVFAARWDSTGEEIWNSLDRYGTFVSGDSAKLYLEFQQVEVDEAENSLYILFLRDDIRYPDVYELWKLNLLDGKRVWVKQLPYKETQSLEGTSFSLADAQRLVILRDSAGTSRPNDELHIRVLDRANGQELDDIWIEADISNKSTADDFGIYVAEADRLLKLNLNNLADTLWERALIPGSSIRSLFGDPGTGRRFAHLEGGSLVEYNPQTGAEIYRIDGVSGGNAYIRNFRLEGFNLYLLWINGGAWACQKILLPGESIEWTTSFAPDGAGIAGTPPGDPISGSNSAFSMDFDSAGDIYLTGAYSKPAAMPSNIHQSTMGFAKISSVDGSVIYTGSIVADSSSFDKYSRGLGVRVLGDKVFYLAHIEERDNPFRVHSSFDRNLWLVETEKANGQVTNITRWKNRFQYPSRTVQLLEDQSGNLIHLYERGRDLHVAKYDANLQLLWDYEFPNHQSPIEVALGVNQLGEIGVVANKNEFDASGRYAFGGYVDINYDSTYVKILSPNGNLLHSEAVPRWALEMNTFIGWSDYFLGIDDRGEGYVFRTSGRGNKRDYGDFPQTRFGLSRMTWVDTLQQRMYNFIDTEYRALGGITSRIFCTDAQGNSCGFLAKYDLLEGKGLVGIDTFLYITGFDNDQNRTAVGKVASGPAGMADEYEWVEEYNFGTRPQAITAGTDGYLYLLSQMDDGIEQYLLIHKVDPEDGAVQWERSYHGRDLGRERPFEIVYHPATDQLLISGISKEDRQFNTEMETGFLLSMDTAGMPLDTFELVGDYHGDNFGQELFIQSNGTVHWAGNWFNAPYGPAGFWYPFQPAAGLPTPVEPTRVSFAVYAYPNPAKDQVSVQWDDPTMEMEMIVRDLTGREIAHHQLNQSPQVLNLKHWPAGLYLIEYRTGGTLLRTQKLQKN